MLGKVLLSSLSTVRMQDTKRINMSTCIAISGCECMKYFRSLRSMYSTVWYNVYSIAGCDFCNIGDDACKF